MSKSNQNLIIYTVIWLITTAAFSATVQFEPMPNLKITIQMDNVDTLYYEPPSKVFYQRDYSFIPLTVKVTIDGSQFSTSCSTDHYYDGTQLHMELQSNVITKFLPDGRLESKIAGSCKTGWFSKNEGAVRLSKTLGDYYLIGILLESFCESNSNNPTISDWEHFVISILPEPNMSLYGFVREGVNGRDPESDVNNPMDPPLDIDNKEDNNNWEFNNKNKKSRGRCETYGRPSYGVNLKALVPCIVDKEFEMQTNGPVLDLTRYHAPGYRGIFGKDWRSSVEFKALISYATASVVSDITIMPDRGRNHTFVYNAEDKVFNPVEFTNDSLKLINDTIMWFNGENKLSHYFGKPDSNGVSLIDSLTDTYGNKLFFNYNTTSQLQYICDNQGRKLNFNYQNNKVSSITTPDGRTASYTYNTDGRLENTYDLQSLHTFFEYDSLNNISAYTFEGQKTTFDYEQIFGRSFLSSITDPTGSIYSYRVIMYPQFSITYVTEPDGTETVYRFNERFDIKQINYGTKTNQYEYNEKGLLIKNIPPLGNPINYTYDESDRLETISKIYNNDFGYIATERIVYNENGLPVRYSDALNNSYHYRYNKKGELVSFKNPAGDSVNYSYNDKGQLTRLTRKENDNYIFNYDNFGNIISLSDSQGTIFSASYDITGQFLTEITDDSGLKSAYTYDNNKRLTGITSPDLTQKIYQYSCCALDALTDIHGKTTQFVRNGLGKLTSMILPNEFSFNLNYDTNHRLTEMSNSAGNTWKITYNSEGLPASVTKPDEGKINYTYDDNNQVESVKDENGSSTTFNYNSNQMISSITDALDNTVYFTYDAVGNRIRTLNSRMMNLTCNFDFNKNVIQKSYQDKVFKFSYDYLARLSKEEGPHGNTNYDYDVRSNIKKISWNNTDIATLTYRSGAKVQEITYPDLLKVKYFYDNYNRIEKVVWNNDSVKFLYYLNGNIQSVIRSNSWNTVQNFDKLGRLNQIEHLHNSNSIIKISTEYSQNGQIKSEQLTAPFDQMLEMPEINLQNTYNALNQIKSNQNGSYKYDDDGNLTEIGSTLQAVYSTTNNLTSLKKGGNSTELEYNGLHQVVSENKNGEITKLFYDAQNKLLFEKNAANVITRKYIYAGSYLVAIIKNNQSYFYHFDRMGNTISLTDKLGNRISDYWYTPFGEKLYERDTLKNRFTFLGNYQVCDEQNGFYRMGYRHYSATDGRFLQKDPEGMIDETNLYTYAHNNPIVLKDPSGRDVANGTADLFSCEGPEYLDSDAIDTETSEWISDIFDKGTDIAPGISDAKSGIKTIYYIQQGNYKDAAFEIANIAGGKYLGGKAGAKAIGKYGEKIGKEMAESIAETLINIGVNGASDKVKEEINSFKAPKRPRDPDNSAIPYIGSRPGRINY